MTSKFSKSTARILRPPPVCHKSAPAPLPAAAASRAQYAKLAKRRRKRPKKGPP